MRLFFRPILSFTALMAPLFAILIGLGVWQIERLHWKLDLIAKIQHGLSAQPGSLREMLDPLIMPEAYRDLQTLTSTQMEKADYRRVRIEGAFYNSQSILFFTTGKDGEPVYHVITPFIAGDLMTIGLCTQCDHNGPSPWSVILVDRGWLPISMGNRKLGGRLQIGTVVGVLRKPASPGWFTPPIDVAHRIVHTRDPQTLEKTFGLHYVFPMFLEADAAPNPGGWPKGGVTVIDLPNDHLQYAITWFGLAAALLFIYFAYHRSRGRLSLKPPLKTR